MKVGIDAIAAALGIGKRAAELRASRNGWVCEKAAVRGGYKMIFDTAMLPASVRTAVERHNHITLRADAARAIDIALARVKGQDEAAVADKRARGERNLKALTEAMAPGVKSRLDARFGVVRCWEGWFAAAQPMTRSASWDAFTEAYNAGDIAVDAAVRAKLPEVSSRSMRRWVLDYERDGMAGLIDHKDGKLRKDVNVFTTQPELEKATVALLIARPHLGVQNLLDLISQAAIDPASGVHLFVVPTYHQAYRYLTAWKAKNAELLTAATNPDQWKNKYMVAFGDASADVVRLNQRWEMDATPADWMLTDEDGRERRYSASVVVDVYSRRMLVVLSPTPKTETHKFALRLALLLWGVPEEIVTDNGKDYQSHDFQETLRQLEIAHHTTAPFSPWEKPHVERGIQTMLHSNLEALSAFVGHNVAERSAIEARRTFAERLFKKDEAVQLALSGHKLQALINDWVTGQYEHRPHGGLAEKTPFEVASAYRGEIQRIQDERALDILLAQPAGKGTYVVTKKGLTIGGANFIAGELALIVGKDVIVRQMPDYGEIAVFLQETNAFVCIAICPERKGVSRTEIAAHARKLQRENVQAQRRAAKAKKVDPDQLVESFLRSKAEAAGKLTAMPQPTVAYSTPALDAAAQAHRAHSGAPKASTVPGDLQQILDKRQAQPQAPQTNVHTMKETPQQRYRRWLDLNELVTNGGSIEDRQQQLFYGRYPDSSEYRAMKKRHQEMQPLAASGGSSVSALQAAR
ncbi:DDE-type integrase/transposase/recombinase [Ralstonia pseudosolanacearum]|uniref:DDE-type integrase/transposase/recombinase n=1 Tax=Ralstonia pseudosolanacearum TaxID=1310165 RepID=UPI0008DABEDF|nr:DDE-type integrase/transposase/recombinase [Ralstonia pseudosolanacearum]MCL1618370.1 DDE-type integrase/transposase/recombinase [Ralstonia pseudosolanacearum CaRs-Mep]